jgi:pimeloyl-ACP methyl ester carboxylesterase
MEEMTGLDHIRLPDGRRLDYRVSGPTGGAAFLYHHGTPGAGTPFRAAERVLHSRGMRLVTMSRPGYGDSDRQPGRHVLDAVADSRAVLHAIGAETCVVAGWSGGGPHALVCAARLEGVAAVVAMASVAPFEADGLEWLAGMGEDNLAEFAAAAQGEDALRTFLEEMRPELKDVSVTGIVSSLDSLLPDVDKALLTDEFGEDMASSFHEALRIGVDGWLGDDLAFVKPWGFALGEISVPVVLWQGSADLMVPFAHGRWLASRLPGARVHLVQGEGHLSVGPGALDRMLDEVLAAAGWG